MSLLFNMLSKFVIAFLPRSKCLLISWQKLPSPAVLKPKKIKSLAVSIVSPSICHKAMELDAMILVLWMLSFKPAFLFFFFTFINRLFSFSLLSALKVVSSHIQSYWHFSWQSCFQLELQSSLTFHMMYSAHKLNKHGDNIQPWHTPFPIWSQFVVPCPVLTNCCFLTCIQISQEADRVFWYSQLFKSPQQLVVIYIVKGFSIVSEADVFLEFLPPAPISGSSAFSKSSLYIWKFSVHYCWS